MKREQKAALKRVTLIDEYGDLEYRGKVDSVGSKQGRGTLYEDGLEIEGYFIDDELEGKVIMKFDDGSKLETVMCCGETDGAFEKIDASGKLMEKGSYKNGVKHGRCLLRINGDCKLDGIWKNGELTQKAEYRYPNGMKIKGKFEPDMLVEDGAWYDKSGKKLKPCPLDPINDIALPIEGLVTDPYEEETVFVKKSVIKGAQEGLYANRAIKAGELCSVYSGMLVLQSKVDRRKWDLNSNTIEVDETYSIDVPEPFHKMKRYRSSLGHKANHSFTPNAQYLPLYHPRFGDVKSVVAMSPIKKGEEITVDYGYASHSKGPKWYQEAKRQEKRVKYE